MARVRHFSLFPCRHALKRGWQGTIAPPGRSTAMARADDATVATIAHRRHARRRAVAFFTALMATALALGGALAHAFALPNKIGMSREDYFVAQQIYAGWNLFAIVLAVEAAGIVALIILHRRAPAVRRPVIVALACLIAAQAVFWTWTFPANTATDQWTRIPENWAAFRDQWEYSHLAGAVLQLEVMAALVVAVLRRG